MWYFGNDFAWAGVINAAAEMRRAINAAASGPEPEEEEPQRAVDVDEILQGISNCNVIAVSKRMEPWGEEEIIQEETPQVGDYFPHMLPKPVIRRRRAQFREKET